MSTPFLFAGLRMVQEEWGEGDDEFALYAHASVQQRNGPIREAFVVQIASPSYLAWLLGNGQEEMLWGRGFILTAEYDEQQIEDALHGLIEREDIESWEALQAHVEKYFDWIIADQ
ncbi:MAG: Imm8 family immunity protein [Armatimonadota bacterium]